MSPTERVRLLFTAKEIGQGQLFANSKPEPTRCVQSFQPLGWLVVELTGSHVGNEAQTTCRAPDPEVVYVCMQLRIEALRLF